MVWGVIGAVVGKAVLGAVAGKAASKILGGSSKTSATQQQQPQVVQPPPVIRNKSPTVELKGDVKVAKAVGVKQAEDPWQSTRDWYEDLGGEADPKSLDFERYM